MTVKENIKSILACNFSGFKDEYIETATKRIMEIYERPRGKWEEPFERCGKTYHKCSCCHISSQLILIDSFCPNCGADMREEGKA